MFHINHKTSKTTKQWKTCKTRHLTLSARTQCHLHPKNWHSTLACHHSVPFVSQKLSLNASMPPLITLE